MVSSEETADHNVSSDKLQQRASPHSDITQSQAIHGTEIHSSEPREETSIPSAVAKSKVKYSDDTTVCASQSDQERSTYSIVRIDTPSREHRLQSDHESPSVIREKVSKDGYNWRKYGQKNVKGNEFIRSYYKCTHPNCQAKKQLEQSNDGKITDSICIGQHNHPRPQSNITQPVESVAPPVVEERPDKPSLANVEGKAPGERGSVTQQIKPSHSPQISNVSPTDGVQAAHLQLTRANDEVHDNEGSDSKRQKRDDSNVDAAIVDRPTCESRVVVQTSSEVDLVNDGYRWRKYGQKLVKGNANPRSYYRCSTPRCPVKKHVERASHDPKIVITTYEGQHDHEIPPGRTVTHNAATTAHATTNTNGKPGTESGGNAVRIDTRDHNCLDLENRSNEQLNSKSITKSEASAISRDNEGPESKTNRQERPHEDSGTKEDPCRSNEQLKDEVETKSEGSKECLNVVAIHDTPGPESELKKQSTSDAEAVQS